MREMTHRERVIAVLEGQKTKISIFTDMKPARYGMNPIIRLFAGKPCPLK